LDAGIDEVMAADVADGELFARLRPLTRLATMHAELKHRAETANLFGIKARDRVATAEAARPSVLFIGADEAVRQVVAETANLTLTQNLYEAQDLLTRQNFDAAVLIADGDATPALDFCAQVRNNPRLFNLPMVLFAKDHDLDAEGYRHGASRVFTGDTDPDVLRAAVLTLVHRQQLRWNIRGALGDSLAPLTRHPVAGCYNRTFLDSYLQGRVKDALTHERPLAVVCFYIPNVDAIEAQHGEDPAQHLLLQLSQWIMGLLRAEDLTASYRRNEFCVVLPDTPLAEAEVVMHRIAGVLGYTDFAVREVYQPVTVWVQVGATELKPGDDMETLVARARQNLD
jgi:two-component system cell cycle response regulator